MPSVALLTLSTFAARAANGSLDVSMNVQGVEVERAAGRAIFSSMHAAFSAGGLVGAGLAALAVVAGVGPVVQFARRRRSRRGDRRVDGAVADPGRGAAGGARGERVARGDQRRALGAARAGVLLPVLRGRGDGLERRAPARDRRGRGARGAGLRRVLGRDGDRAARRRLAQRADGPGDAGAPRRRAGRRRDGGVAARRRAGGRAVGLHPGRRRAVGRSRRWSSAPRRPAATPARRWRR